MRTPTSLSCLTIMGLLVLSPTVCERFCGCQLCTTTSSLCLLSAVFDMVSVYTSKLQGRLSLSDASLSCPHRGSTGPAAHCRQIVQLGEDRTKSDTVARDCKAKISCLAF